MAFRESTVPGETGETVDLNGLHIHKIAIFPMGVLHGKYKKTCSSLLVECSDMNTFFKIKSSIKVKLIIHNFIVIREIGINNEKNLHIKCYIFVKSIFLNSAEKSRSKNQIIKHKYIKHINIQ